MLGVNTCAADSEAEARLLFTSTQQAFINLRTGRAGRLPPPIEGFGETLEPVHRQILDGVLSSAVVGSPDQVRAGLNAFAQKHGADELILTSQIFDHAKRVRSYEIAAEAMGLAVAA
jgi:alkanesulfonate monooxygenase SsuD/methylene tetrahydromethanopterin reductase-like flavin-dependent oxidoreductase (luciferase family)